MKNNSTKKLKRKTLLSLALIILIIIVISYISLPILLNYPPYTENNFSFQNEIEPFNHLQQYIFMFLMATLICYITINLLMNNIYKFLKKYDAKESISHEEIIAVRKDCFNIPYIFYLLEISVCIILPFFLAILFDVSYIFRLKYSLALITLITIIGLLQFMFLQKNLNQIALLTYDKSSNFDKIAGIRVKFSSNLILQVIPFLLVSIIIISLFGYAKTSTEKANSIATYYKLYLENKSFSEVNIEDLQAELSTIPLYSESDYYIILSPNNNISYTSDPNQEISDFFSAYLRNFYNDTNGVIYEYYGYEQQAYLIDLLDENGNIWYIGFEYTYTDLPLLYSYLTLMIAISILYGIFVYIWSRNISSNLTSISEALDYVRKENDYNSQRYLPILSNDEFGDISYSYNKIEEMTNLHLKEIQDNQDILVEQERLASLGQMIGGIAHNLKTPIFSVAGGLEGLSDLINEYDQSIGNPQVTNEDFHAIAKDMKEWITKLRDHISYMSDVITTVKGQTVALSESETINFSVEELFKRVDILMRHELNNALATLKITNNIGDEDILHGNINSLVQIINNMISNAIEAYGNNYTDKKIELSANTSDNNIVICIKDYGPGIPEKAQEKLFKEMITTKGKNGTGLGMFMSYSNIKAHFNGDLTYETELGKGTTFYITLPMNK